jgi:hypothetical protein
LQQNSGKSSLDNWLVTFFQKLCGYTKIRQKKREKNTASKFLCMTGRPVLEPEEKILFLIIKKIVAKFRNLANLFSDSERKHKKICDFIGLISPFFQKLK